MFPATDSCLILAYLYISFRDHKSQQGAYNERGAKAKCILGFLVAKEFFFFSVESRNNTVNSICW